MKKILSFVGFMACLFVLSACSSDENTNPYAKTPAITIESADVIFQSGSGQGSVVCNAPNGITKVETNAAWCSASYNGNTVMVNVENNNKNVSRVCMLKIYSGEEIKTVNVQQMGLVFSINNGDDTEVNAAPQSFDLAIDYSGLSSYNIVDGIVDWATFTIVDGKLHVDLKVNADSAPRTTEIELSDGNASTKTKITQGGLFFIVNDDHDYATDDAASTKDLSIATVDGIDYTVEPSSVDWAAFSIVNGALRVALKANTSGAPRFTKAVIIYGGSLKKEVNISQYEFADALGDFDLIYRASDGDVSTSITLEKNSEGNYQVRFNDYVSNGYVLPVICDEEMYTITIGNLTEMEGSYNKSGTYYSVMSMINYTNGSSVYRKNDPQLILVGKFDPQSATWNFEFDPNGVIDHSKYMYYAFRIAYTTGGYAGYKGAVITFAYMTQWKKSVVD